MTAWPASLPGPDLNYERQPVCGLNDDEETRNPERTRTYPEREQKVRFSNLSATQFAALRTWWEGGLCYGAALFTADWLATLGYTFHRARFIEPYTAKRKGVSWTVEAKLEIIAGVETTAEGDPIVYVPEGWGTDYVLSFDGVDDYARSDDQVFDGTGDFTIVVWFKTGMTTMGELISQRQNTVDHQEPGLILTRIDGTDGSVEGYIADADWNLFSCVSAGEYNDGAWHMLAFQREGTTLRLNLDGGSEIVTTSGVTTSDVAAGGNVVYLGAYTAESGPSLLSGLLKGGRFYNCALSVADISALYADPDTEVNAENLLAHYRMNDGEGTTLTDSTGNHNGVIVGATWEEA